LLVKADVSDVAQVRAMISQAVEHFGCLDVLVNNAGIQVQAPFWEVSEEDYDKVLDVNLKGTFFATQVFAQYLIGAKRPGRVINISSVHEELPFPGHAAYCASKGGLRVLTRNLAVELAPHGIVINNIAPGAIETPMNADIKQQPQKYNALLENIPLRRLGTPEDVAGLAAFLAGADAEYITGATFFVDGGLTWNYRE
jgi:glucose 1-dehydrogenase